MKNLLRFLAENNIKVHHAISNGKTPVGFHVSSCSYIRKPHVLKIVEDFIKANCLSLKVEDTYPDNSQFKIYIA